ncbi:CoA ester lyase [Nocardiopsis rhodophaea]|uniref:HpcH/HpaI aldolase/citrate lyase family protein n=1 Tax=Nocardiopsis rhodophaea TaxID=280238 RepID=UPI0031DEA5C2
MNSLVHRSCLYVPAHRHRMVEKAYASEADAIVLDLEDAVPQPYKADARTAAADILSGGPPKPTYVRVNGPHSELCRADVEAVALPSLAALRLPKVEDPEPIRRVAGWLEVAESPAGIQILVESARGLEALPDLAAASPRLERVGLGENDLRADLHAAFDSPTMQYARVRCVVATRAAGLAPPPQSVFPRLDDADGLRASCEDGQAMGFLGRFAAHPAQVPVINDVFTPSDRELRRAGELVAAASARSDSSVFLDDDGRPIAPPLVAQARAVLAIADSLDSSTRLEGAA